MDFLYENNISLCSTGNYDFPKDIATKSCYEFLTTGKSDIIKKHQRWTWLCWDLDSYLKRSGCLSSEPNLSSWKELRELKIFWKDNSLIGELDEIIINESIREEDRQKYSYKRKSGFKPSLRKQCLERDVVCVRCLCSTTLEVDHIKELIDGGDNSLNNLQTLCCKCHREKTTSEARKRKQLL